MDEHILGPIEQIYQQADQSRGDIGIIEALGSAIRCQKGITLSYDGKLRTLHLTGAFGFSLSPGLSACFEQYLRDCMVRLGQDQSHRQMKPYQYVSPNSVSNPTKHSQPTENPVSFDYWLSRPLIIIAIHHCGDRQELAALSYDGELAQWRDNEAPVLDALISHIRRASDLNRKYRAALITEQLESRIIDNFDFGVMIVDWAGEVLLRNRAATNILAQEDGLSLRCNRLIAQDPAQQKILRSIFQGKMAFGTDCRDIPPKVLSIPHRSGTTSYWLQLQPISLQHIAENVTIGTASLCTRSVLGIYITYSGRPIELSTEQLRIQFSLTRCEAMVAQSIFQGRSLKQHAEMAGHSVGTTRNLLKRVYLKTDTCHQSQLSAVLFRSMVPLLMLKEHRLSNFASGAAV